MKQLTKRLFSALLCLIFLFGLLPPVTVRAAVPVSHACADASEEEAPRTLASVSHVPPGCEGILSPSDFPRSSGSLLTAASYPKYSTAQAAGAAIRSVLKERGSSLIIQWTGSTSGDFLTEICSEALKHTGNPIEGDYLTFQNAYFIEYKSNGLIVCDFYPYSTVAQEKKVTKEASKLLASLKLNGKSNYEKVKAIYDYICTHVKYDTVHPDSYLTQFTAFGALVNGSAVCQGYAALFYRLALEAGIDNRIIFNVDHAWNIARMGSKYYNLDSTWDSMLPVQEYFLKGSKDFPDHQANPEYLTSQFRKKYPIASYGFKPASASAQTATQNLSSFSVDLSSTSFVYSGKECVPSVIVKNGSLTLENGKDYTVSYIGNNAPGTAELIVTGTGSYIGSICKTFTIKPPTVQLKSAVSSAGGVTVSWKKASGASNYVIYRKTGGESWKRITTVSSSSTSYLDKSAANATAYVYTVRAVSDGINGGYDKAGMSVYYLSRPTLSSAVNQPGDTLSLKWSKNSKADGYQVQYSLASSFQSPVAQTIKGKNNVSCTLSGLTRSKTYYVRIRAWKNVGETAVFSAWSSSKKVKITK